jgi:hypothetical protein
MSRQGGGRPLHYWFASCPGLCSFELGGQAKKCGLIAEARRKHYADRDATWRPVRLAKRYVLGGAGRGLKRIGLNTLMSRSVPTWGFPERLKETLARGRISGSFRSPFQLLRSTACLCTQNCLANRHLAQCGSGKAGPSQGRQPPHARPSQNSRSVMTTTTTTP